MNELLRDSHPALNKSLYQFAECIVEGKSVSKKVLELIVGLTGFERGGVFLGDTEKGLELRLRHGTFKDIKAVRLPNNYERHHGLVVRNCHPFVVCTGVQSFRSHSSWPSCGWIGLVWTIAERSSRVKEENFTE